MSSPDKRKPGKQPSEARRGAKPNIAEADESDNEENKGSESELASSDPQNVRGRSSKVALTKANRKNQVINSTFDLMLSDAVANFQITERAKAEIVQRQLVQFSEILKIRLRNRIIEYKILAGQIWNSLEQDGGQFFIPESIYGVQWDSGESRWGNGGISFIQSRSGTSAGASGFARGAMASSLGGLKQIGGVLSFLTSSGLAAKLVVVGASGLMLSTMYNRILNSYRAGALFLAGSFGVHMFDLKKRAWELERCLNVLLAFEETGDDELENERVVRIVAERLALRHINHVSKLSKSGQKTLATVMVDRICRHLSRHRFGYEDESPVWLKSTLQQFYWSTETYMKRLILPADKVPRRARLDLFQRIIRALSAENSDNDFRTLDVEPLHQSTEDTYSSKRAWNAADLLSRSAILVPESGTVYLHAETLLDVYGVAYGTLDEVTRRQMQPQETSNQSETESSKERQESNENPPHAASKL